MSSPRSIAFRSERDPKNMNVAVHVAKLSSARQPQATSAIQDCPEGAADTAARATGRYHTYIAVATSTTSASDGPLLAIDSRMCGAAAMGRDGTSAGTG